MCEACKCPHYPPILYSPGTKGTEKPVRFMKYRGFCISGGSIIHNICKSTQGQSVCNVLDGHFSGVPVE